MTTRISIATFFLFSLSISLFTCIDTIDFAQPEAIQGAITIQGKLTKGNPSQIEVRIGEVFNFSETPRLIDAKYVELIDDRGNKLNLPSKVQGIYKLDILGEEALKVEYGKGYQIKTELNNGQLYESTFDTLYPVTTPLRLSSQKTQEIRTNALGIRDTAKFIAFNISTLFPKFEGQKVNLLWEMESTFKLTDSPRSYSRCPRDCQTTSIDRLPKTCFVTINPIQNYKTLKASSLSGDEVMDFNVLTENANSFIFAEGLYLTVFQQSLSESAYEYWSIVAQLTNRSGDIFEAPAGRITSNIRNVEDSKAAVFGYFYATESTMQRIYVAPALADFPKFVCPVLPNPDGSGPGNCCDCLCELNSTIEQPVWWVE